MSIRCLWILSVSKEDFGKIILYRKFPTVEKRCKSLLGEKYISVPPPAIFVNNLLVKLGLSISFKQFVEWRDKASGAMQLPVTEVKIGDNEIWPVISIIQRSLVLCCLPLVEGNDIEKKDLLQIPSISVGFSVLLGILDFLETRSFSKKDADLMQLDNYLTLSMPFGSPSDKGPACASYLDNVHTHEFLKKQPAWKPFDYKGKQKIHIKIVEFVRSVQSDNNGSLCVYEAFGQVAVKADLEGTQNNITVLITSSDSDHSFSLDSILVHPNVQIHSTSSGSASNLTRLWFSPPLHEFTILNYFCNESKDPPIQGVFKMRGENTVELLLQLKLNEKVKNSFDYCYATVVFFNRGPVNLFEYNANHGIIKLSNDKHFLKWDIGTKLPKGLEVVVTAKLKFDDEPIYPNSDPFCVDQNCYAQINFKQNNSTLSGCNIDPKSVIVSQGSKPKVTVERSVESSEYRIWNNYGDLPFPSHILKEYEKIS